MIKILLGVRFQLICHSVFSRSGKKKTSPVQMAGAGVLCVYLLGIFLFLFGGFFKSILEPFHEMGIDWMYFGFMILMALALMFIGSLFLAQSQIYEAKDNEQLLALPIPPAAILMSRMLLLYLLNLVFELPAFASGAFLYGQRWGIRPVQGVFLAVIFLLLPLLAIAAACGFGALVAAVSSRIKRKSMFTVVLFLLFMVLYFYGYSKMTTAMAMLIANGKEVADSFKGGLTPLYHLGAAVSGGNIRYFLYSLCYLLVPFGVVYGVLSVTFLRIVTRKPVSTRVRYQHRKLYVKPVRIAMIQREFRHFAGNPWYILNAGLGIFVLVGMGGFLIFRPEYLDMLLLVTGGNRTQAQLLAILAVCMIQSTIIVSAPSVSLEGKRLWIIRTCPVSSGDVLLAKADFHMLVALPGILFAGVVLSAAGRFDAVMTAVLALDALAMNAFGGLLGVAVNLKFPKLEFLSETAVIKNSASSVLVMLGQIAVVLLPGMLVMMTDLGTGSFAVPLMILYGLLLAAVAAALRVWIKGKGAQIFETL